ncbi:MAG: hypothetical protein WC325_11790 [Candidatus Bathyarchaeia archaeon]|jgi:hypothetical protein
MTEYNADFFSKTVVPRVFKAALWGAVTFVIVYYLPMMFIPKDIPQSIIPFDIAARLLDFAVLSVFFAVAGQLFAGTIYGCGFGIAKSIAIIGYFFWVSEGGIFHVSVPIQDITINVTLDISIILLMIVSVNLLSIAKNLIEALTILTDKTNGLEID